MDEKELLEQWIAERDQLNLLIEGLQKRLSGEAGGSTSPLVKSGGTTRIQPGEFFRLSQTDAAAAYLKKIGHAVHIDQILAALQVGGIKLKGKNPKAILYTALVRGTKRFVLVSPGTFGLAEFYPNRKIGEKKEGE